MRPNTTTVSTISVIATMVALLGAPAFAVQNKGPLTRADAIEMAGKRFDKIDVDGDGVVTAEERKGARKHAVKDSKDQSEKMRTHPGGFFTKIDADGSGDLSAEEFVSAAKRMEKHRETKRDQKNEGKHEGKVKLNPAERFAELDVNQDGVLSKEEFGPGKEHRKQHGAEKHKDK